MKIILALVQKQNRILFTVIFFWDQALFRLQQYKYKIDDKMAFLIIWKEFKVFFCWSLRRSWAFVNSIWKSIRKDS